MLYRLTRYLILLHPNQIFFKSLIDTKFTALTRLINRLGTNRVTRLLDALCVPSVPYMESFLIFLSPQFGKFPSQFILIFMEIAGIQILRI